MSRSLGDAPLKEGTKKGQIIATPHVNITPFPLSHNDLIILASDGVWDVVSNRKIARIAQRTLLSRAAEAEMKSSEDHDSGDEAEVQTIQGNNTLMKQLAIRIRDRAYDKGSRDNIGVIAIRVNVKEPDLGPWELID